MKVKKLVEHYNNNVCVEAHRKKPQERGCCLKRNLDSLTNVGDMLCFQNMQ